MPRRKASLDSFWPKRALIKIKAAIFSYRNERSPSVLLIHTVYTLGATVVDPGRENHFPIIRLATGGISRTQ
jgi:hypothetical protein